MNRLVIRGQVYRPLAVHALLESEFAALVRQDATALFPAFHLVPFALPVQSEYGRFAADFALVHSGYRQWWVVEVELSTHSFAQHVMPQVQALSSASYSIREARHLASRAPELDPRSLEQMMLGAQPRVLVVVEEPCSSWELPLAVLGAHLMVIEVYRSERDAFALRAVGAPPVADDRIVSWCVPEPALGRAFLAVQSPAALPVASGASLEIEMCGRSSMWRRIDVQDKVWLVADSGIPRLNEPVALACTESGRFVLLDASAARRRR